MVSIDVKVERISLASSPIPSVVTDFITELIDYVTNGCYLIPPDQLIASYERDKVTNNEGNENGRTVLRPIPYQEKMFYLCLRLKEFLDWSSIFSGSSSKLDLVQVSHLIPGLSVKTDMCYRSGVRLQQIKVLKQFVGGYCGHHAYFNALALLNATSTKDQRLAVLWLFMTGQRLAYWKRYWETIRMLSSYAELTGESWPWIVRDIEKGCVERTYMSYLLTSDPNVLIHGRYKLHVLQFAYGSIQSPKSDLFPLNRALEELKQSGPSSLAIILGVTNHWLAVVIYKIDTRDETWTASTLSNTATVVSKDPKYVYRVVFMDSNNAPIIEASESALEAYYLRHCARYERRKKEKMTDWKSETFRQVLEDERQLMRIVVSCVTGNSLLYYSFKSNLQRMLLNFYIQVDTVCQMKRQDYIPDIPLPWFLRNKNHTNPNNPDYLKYCTSGYPFPPDLDQYMLTLMNWLEGWYRPKELRRMICGDMKEFAISELDIEEELSSCLALWSSHLLSVLTGVTQLDIPILVELVDVLIDISETFNS